MESTYWTEQLSEETRELILSHEKFAAGFETKELSTQDEYDSLASGLKDVKGRMKEIKFHKENQCLPFKKALDNLKEFFDRPLKRLSEIEKMAKEAIANYEKKKVAEAIAEDIKIKGQKITVSDYVEFHKEPIEKPKGIATLTKYKTEVIDKNLFLTWCIQQKKLEYININESLLNKEAQATKGQRQWPGITINTKKEVRVTA